MYNQLNSKMLGSMPARSKGMALLDVILAIVIFVVGMLALASLQGNLTRASADANAKTVASNIAEELIEGLRTIEEINLPDGGSCDTSLVDRVAQNIYECVATSSTANFPRAGNIFDLSATVEDWYLMEDGVSVTNDPANLPENWDVSASTYKLVNVTVNWVGANNERAVPFQGVDADAADPLLGSGSVTVSAVVPSIPNLGSAKIAAGQPDAASVPLIDYSPGLRPDIVAINLGDSKFKESTTPMPDVVRRDELVETWFDVITYNQDAGATFIRREEFLVISCECTLKAKPGDNSDSGLLPTVWNGFEYSEIQWASKAYGESASPQQSVYCDTCCRDHHDPESPSNAEDVYDPVRFNNGNGANVPPVWTQSGGINSDHAHYKRSNNAGLTLATQNQTYVEACRMVRKDGFMRVAQDLRQEGLLAFPEGYLDTQSGIDEYSGYVTSAVNDFYVNGRQSMATPDGNVEYPAISGAIPSVTFPGESSTNATNLPFLGVQNFQQMRSRGIYLDTLSTAASTMLSCMLTEEVGYVPGTLPTPGDTCGSPGATNHMQILPFYELQTTWLSWWETSADGGDPISVTSEPVADSNSHSRGMVVLENLGATGNTYMVSTNMFRGNTGLTVTDPISDLERADASKFDEDVYVDVNGGGDGILPDPTHYTWSGMFGSSVNRVDADSAQVVEGGNTYCSRASQEIRCATPLGEGGSIRISGYTFRQNANSPYQPLYICVSGLEGVGVISNTDDPANNYADISWNAGVDTSGVIISIESNNNCL